jgi:hypothetical protein
MASTFSFISLHGLWLGRKTFAQHWVQKADGWGFEESMRRKYTYECTYVERNEYNHNSRKGIRVTSDSPSRVVQWNWVGSPD